MHVRQPPRLLVCLVSDVTLTAGRGERTAAAVAGAAAQRVHVAIGVICDIEDVKGRQALEEAAAAEDGEEVVALLGPDVESRAQQHLRPLHLLHSPGQLARFLKVTCAHWGENARQSVWGVDSEG